MNLDAVNWGAWIPTLIFIVPPFAGLIGFLIGWMVGFDRGWKEGRRRMIEWIEDRDR